MALFNRYILKDFTKERYLALARSYPKLSEERTQIYIMLILTFISLSFLGMFAINPTLTTIVELNKKLSDSEFVSNALKTKIDNLSSLNTQYEALANTWPIVNLAAPNTPEAVMLLGQMQAIAKESNVQLIDLGASTVELSKPATKKTLLPKAVSFAFFVTAIGEKNNLIQFTKLVANFDRVVALESISYSNEEEESVNITGRVFFTL